MKLPVGMKKQGNIASRSHAAKATSNCLKTEIGMTLVGFSLYQTLSSQRYWLSGILKNKILFTWYRLLVGLNLMLMRLTFILGYFAI